MVRIACWLRISRRFRCVGVGTSGAPKSIGGRTGQNSCRGRVHARRRLQNLPGNHIQKDDMIQLYGKRSIILQRWWLFATQHPSFKISWSIPEPDETDLPVEDAPKKLKFSTGGGVRNNSQAIKLRGDISGMNILYLEWLSINSFARPTSQRPWKNIHVIS